jgi:hypothetical protein
MGGRSKHEDFFITVIVGLRKIEMRIVPYFCVNSTPKTSDKLETNGDRHRMSKVIQRVVAIAKF